MLTLIVLKFPTARLNVDKLKSHGNSEYELHGTTKRAKALLKRESIWEWPRGESTVSILNEMIEKGELVPRLRQNPDNIGLGDVRESTKEAEEGRYANTGPQSLVDMEPGDIAQSSVEGEGIQIVTAQPLTLWDGTINIPYRENFVGGSAEWKRAGRKVMREILASCIGTLVESHFKLH